MTQKMLTTIITIKEKHNFEKCIQSLFVLNCEFILLDCIGVASIKSYCKTRNITYIKHTDYNLNYSNEKNKAIGLCKTDWIFFIDSNETIINGHNFIKEIVNTSDKPEIYSVSILNEFTITKEIRLFHKNKKVKFQNAYYESVIEKSQAINVFISTKNIIDYNKILKHFIEEEEKQPNQNNYKYYSACCYLACNMINEFISKSEEFLFLSKKNDMPQIMINYYLALVKCTKKLNLQSALKHILVCILYKPDMAEFWCCLGDIYYQLNETEKAKIFYTIAISVGKKRKKHDLWPLEIKKYKEYPNKMIQSCVNIEEKRKEYKKI